MNTGHNDQADKDLQEALRFRPDSAEVHYYLAILHGIRGSVLRQREEFSEAVRLDPRLLPARIALSRLLIFTSAYKAALDTMDAAPEVQKHTLDAIVQRNWALLTNGSWAELRAGVDNGRKMGRIPDLLVQNAVLKILDKKLPEARASLYEALEINPEDLRSLNLLARTYGTDQHAALNVVRDHALKYPKSPAIQYFWSEWLRRSGDSIQARAVLSSVVAENPNSARAVLSLAGMDAEEGRFQEARTRLQSMVKSNGGGDEARLMLAKVEHASGNWSGAIDAYKNFIAIEPENVEALNNLAYLLSESANQPNEAFPYAQKAVEAAPGNAAVQDTLGWILYRKGLFPSAVKELENAVKKEQAPLRQYHLAMAYFKAGDRRRGDETLALALRANPRLPEAQLAQQMQKEMRDAAEKR